MRPIKSSPKGLALACLVGIVTACLVLPASCSPADQQENHEPELEQQQTSSTTVPTLFDFNNYQQLFKKRYGSTLERVTRHVYFLAKAFAAYASGVAYRLWKQSYYLAVNGLSDRSPQELAMMMNKYAAEEGAKARPSEIPVQTEATFEVKDPAASTDPAQMIKVIEGKISEALQKPEFKSLLEDMKSPTVCSRRRKRNAPSQAGETSKRPPRALSMDQLIKGNEHKAEPAWVRQAKVNKNPKSTNSQYDELAREGISRGLVDQQENIRWWDLSSLALSQVSSSLEAITNPLDDRYDADNDLIMGDASQLSDEMFADLRLTGCWFPPRHQGECGACYAFGAISMMEFLFCTKTGQLTAFSEQYMINCGKGLVEEAYGCGGASISAVPKFIHNFGVELWEHYPYLGREGECPYDKDTNLKTTGFFRIDLGDVAEIPVQLWPEALKFGPLMVGIAASDDFSQYGGDIYDGHGCKEFGNHIMVLIGHGRLGGQEFWLLRNSYGTEWGEYGHFKLAKSAPHRCIHLQRGYALGSADGANFVNPKANSLNERARQWLLQQQQQQIQQQVQQQQ